MNLLTYFLAKKKVDSIPKKVHGIVKKYTVATGATINAGDFVTLTGNKIKRASVYDKILGISRENGVSGQSVKIYVSMGSG